MAEDRPVHPPEWLASAQSNARNLGLTQELADLSPEHWQRVLANVEAKMRMQGAALPADWREALAQQAGRTDPVALTKDEADTRLAEKGEVFATEDDA